MRVGVLYQLICKILVAVRVHCIEVVTDLLRFLKLFGNLLRKRWRVYSSRCLSFSAVLRGGGLGGRLDHRCQKPFVLGYCPLTRKSGEVVDLSVGFNELLLYPVRDDVIEGALVGPPHGQTHRQLMKLTLFLALRDRDIPQFCTGRLLLRPAERIPCVRCFARFFNAQLQEQCQFHQQPFSGRKADLQERLRLHLELETQKENEIKLPARKSRRSRVGEDNR
jgi:hypothetical protein